MAARNKAWWAEPWFQVEAFALVNLGFITLDIYMAHSVNEFRRSEEYIPLYFSALSPLVLITGLALRSRWKVVWTDLGHLVGWGAILVGLTGVVLHLDSSFFYERTIKSLTYSAPFAAPLAYAGLGFLIVLNRMVDSDSMEWAQWVLFLTLGGFFGNIVLTLSDHAGNGFFYPPGVGRCCGQRDGCGVSGDSAAGASFAVFSVALCCDPAAGGGCRGLGILAARRTKSAWSVDAVL
ncbi:MAG TPA: hypothetical protein VFE61_29435 [Candidatus Sulfotelmatobacter sp.]|nr:hypothetical protein [Candidatus Sulfotelmatobacter sp.]